MRRERPALASECVVTIGRDGKAGRSTPTTAQKETPVRRHQGEQIAIELDSLSELLRIFNRHSEVGR
jgi:hypothetical protein